MLGDDGLFSQVTGDPDSIKSKIRKARSSDAQAFRIRLPELPFVEVYDQPPAVPGAMPDPPGYTSYRKQFEQSAGIRLPDAAMQPPRSPRAERATKLRQEIARAVADENYSAAARIRGELDVLLQPTPPRSAQLESELADAVGREDYAAAARLKKELAEAQRPEA